MDRGGRASGWASALLWRARRRRLRRRLERSLIAIPACYLVGAVVLGALAPRIDDSRDAPLRLDTGMDTARDILTSTATGMIAFTGLVIASVLVVVQFAAGQYSPRLILWFRRDRLVKHAIGSFLAAFLYALVALRAFERRDEQYAPDLTVTLALVLLIGASLLFLALLQRTMDRLRPRALYAAVGREAVTAVHAVYPRPLGAADDDGTWAVPQPRPVHWSGGPGVVSAFDRELLVQAAEAADVTIDLAVAVGEFVDPGQELLRIHGTGGDAGALVPRVLHAGVAIGEERTIEQDPAFAMRIVVDTAIRALSPAVNDPTTAVQGLDVLEPIVRVWAARDLDASLGAAATAACGSCGPRPTGKTCSTSRSTRSASTARARSRSAGACARCWMTCAPAPRRAGTRRSTHSSRGSTRRSARRTATARRRRRSRAWRTAWASACTAVSPSGSMPEVSGPPVATRPPDRTLVAQTRPGRLPGPGRLCKDPAR